MKKKTIIFFQIALVLIIIGFSAIMDLNARNVIRPQSTRAFGMGSAFTAVSDDFNAMFFNPAGLGSVKQIESSALFGRYFPPDSYPQTDMHVAGVLPLERYRENWSFGIVGGYLQHTEEKEGYSYTNLAGSWGANLKEIVSRIPYLPQYKTFEDFSIGFQPQIKRVRGSESVSVGLGLDFGLLYFIKDGPSKYEKGRSVGIAVQDLNSQSVSAPVLIRMGAAWKSPYAILALDMTAQEGNIKFFPGLEAPLFNRLIQVRAGTAVSEGSARQLSLGLGVILPPMQIDVAYGCPWGAPLKTDDRILFSFTYRFEAPHLMQYFYQERVDKVNEVENQIANLESKKGVLESSVREQKSVYRTVSDDLERAIAERSQAREESRNLSETIMEKKKTIETLEKKIGKLGKQKEEFGADVERKKFEREFIEIRAPKSGNPRRHKVIKGDSLRSLSETYYGDPNQWKVIFDANPDKMIRGTPKAGEEIVIP